MRVFGMFFNGAAVLRMHPKSISNTASSVTNVALSGVTSISGASVLVHYVVLLGNIDFAAVQLISYEQLAQFPSSIKNSQNNSRIFITRFDMLFYYFNELVFVLLIVSGHLIMKIKWNDIFRRCLFILRKYIFVKEELDVFINVFHGKIIICKKLFDSFNFFF